MADALQSTRELIKAVTQYYQSGTARKHAPHYLQQELEGVIVLLSLGGDKCNKAFERYYIHQN
jgi:hypothetical protein|tara:strand:- start:839 stop:1027 length:189 start_codon:yes stop_codon:yes gene_type:complete